MNFSRFYNFKKEYLPRQLYKEIPKKYGKLCTHIGPTKLGMYFLSLQFKLIQTQKKIDSHNVLDLVRPMFC